MPQRKSSDFSGDGEAWNSHFKENDHFSLNVILSIFTWLTKEMKLVKVGAEE